MCPASFSDRKPTAELTIRSKTKPSLVGINPYNYYVDRNSDDNLFAVEG